MLISHMHADHHLGLLRILAIRQELEHKGGEVGEGLMVVGPPALKEWLDEYSSQIQALRYRFVPCHALNMPHFIGSVSISALPSISSRGLMPQQELFGGEPRDHRSTSYRSCALSFRVWFCAYAQIGVEDRLFR